MRDDALLCYLEKRQFHQYAYVPPLRVPPPVRYPLRKHQTMTISTAIVSEHTTAENRSKELSRLTAAMTFAFIVGPSLGSFLYQRSKILPPMVRRINMFSSPQESLQPSQQYQHC